MHREKELKKAEEDLNKMKKKAEESCKETKEKQQVEAAVFFRVGYLCCWIGGPSA